MALAHDPDAAALALARVIPTAAAAARFQDFTREELLDTAVAQSMQLDQLADDKRQLAVRVTNMEKVREKKTMIC